MNEARNLRNMTMQQTPLLGDENTPLRSSSDSGTGFESATPRHQIPVTPNPLATPRDVNIPAGTPLRTPMRDSLNINANDGRSRADDTPGNEKYVANQAGDDPQIDDVVCMFSEHLKLDEYNTVPLVCYSVLFICSC